MVRIVAAMFALEIATGAHAAGQWTASGKWNLDLKPANCTIGRVFGSGAQQVSLGFKVEPPSLYSTLLIAAPASTLDNRSTSIVISSPDIQPFKAVLSYRGLTRAGAQLFWVLVERRLLPVLLRAQEVTLEGAGAKLTLPIGGSAGVVKAVDDCENGLLAEWKIDRAEANVPINLSVDARQRGWLTLTPDDYPAEAVRAAQQGSVGMVWKAESSGRVTECRVVESSGVASLDKKSCEIMLQRARVEPFVGPDGKQAVAWKRTTINWVLPTY